MKPNPEQDADRAAFEKWVKEHCKDQNIYRDGLGEYCDHATFGDWVVWQAALSQPSVGDSEPATSEDDALEIMQQGYHAEFMKPQGLHEDGMRGSYRALVAAGVVK